MCIHNMEPLMKEGLWTLSRWAAWAWWKCCTPPTCWPWCAVVADPSPSYLSAGQGRCRRRQGRQGQAGAGAAFTQPVLAVRTRHDRIVTVLRSRTYGDSFPNNPGHCVSSTPGTTLRGSVTSAPAWRNANVPRTHVREPAACEPGEHKARHFICSVSHQRTSEPRGPRVPKPARHRVASASQKGILIGLLDTVQGKTDGTAPRR